jgi:DNA recombination protein RmuC
MDVSLITIVCLLLGLVFGAFAGWFAGSRPVAELRQRWLVRDGEARDLDARFLRTFADLEAARERAGQVDGLAGELATARGDREGLRAQLATLTANVANFDEQKRLLFEAQEALKQQFEAAGAKVLESAQAAFLKRAEDRFAQSETASAERLSTLLAPVGERLKSYELQVAQLEKQRVDAFGQLTGQIEGMRAGQEQVRVEAARLGNVLRNAPKTRGRWGEQQLKNVLEQCGLSEHTDYVTEHSVDTEDGRVRPDALVFLPGNKLLVIDAKVSLKDYYDACEATDDIERDAHLGRHVASIRNHIQTLGTKQYQGQFPNTPDYTIMFVPGENHLSAAIEHDERKTIIDDNGQRRTKDLWTLAFEKRILLVSPTNLVAIARTVSEVWRQDGLAKGAREIGKLASDLYESLAKTQEDLAKTGLHLGRAVNSFNDFAKTYDGNVLSRARRLTEKNVKINKREVSDEIPIVEAKPRYGDDRVESVDADAGEPLAVLLVSGSTEVEQEAAE